MYMYMCIYIILHQLRHPLSLSALHPPLAVSPGAISSIPYTHARPETRT